MHRTASLVLITVLTALTACSTGTTHDGSEYVFRVNELIVTLPYTIAPVFGAADTVVRDDMQWTVERAELADRNARIVARGAGDNTRRISLVSIGNDRTEIRVIVNDGPFGNAERSRDVIARIEERLANGN